MKSTINDLDRYILKMFIRTTFSSILYSKHILCLTSSSFRNYSGQLFDLFQALLVVRERN